MDQNMLIKRVCHRGQKLSTQLYAWFELRNESTIIDVNTFLSLMEGPKYIDLNCTWNIHQNRLYSEL